MKKLLQNGNPDCITEGMNLPHGYMSQRRRKPLSVARGPGLVQQPKGRSVVKGSSEGRTQNRDP